MHKAVILLSGGLDSATVLAMAKAQGFEPYALSFAYGQRHAAEMEAARRVAGALGAREHRIAAVDLSSYGGSALTDAAIEVPKHRDAEDIGQGIPVTYVPARNTVFLSLALAWAEVLKAYDIFIGVNALDYSGYPDCRPEFIEAFELMANLATAYGAEGGKRIRIHAPLMRMDKAQIIAEGVKLGVDYGLTLSCYDPTPQGAACGACDACLLRLRGFRTQGSKDPARYAEAKD